MAKLTLAQARQLALLGIILQSLHVLFGVTAVMGVLIAHVKLLDCADTPDHSHLRWQIITFWIGLLAYSLALWAWTRFGVLWPAVATLAFIGYRISVNLFHWLSHRPLNRYF